MNLIVYYNTRKTAGLVVVNNMPKKKTQEKANGLLQKTNVIYQFLCPEDGCRLLKNDKYIGETTTIIVFLYDLLTKLLLKFGTLMYYIFFIYILYIIYL